VEYGTCRACGQSNPLSRRFCVLCGRESWAGGQAARPKAAPQAAPHPGAQGLMDTLDARVEQRREQRLADQAQGQASTNRPLDRTA
jgi:hypothetical protein